MPNKPKEKADQSLDRKSQIFSCLTNLGDTIHCSMNKEQMIRHIFDCADSIGNIVEDYNEENLDLFLGAPDHILHKMASVLSDAHRHLDQNLSVFQPEFEKIRQTEDDDD